ncbi:hypothetical protein WJX74_000122 [Apatococcus lobatus]|uniref:Deacetylase sirtuin-type domain-containing protein n=1 Tax=Apatococcus lobatus TaxID=904363 RepID=A0AAW1RQ59_9CHLO
MSQTPPPQRPSYGLRKRKQPEPRVAETAVTRLVAAAAQCKHVVIFSGSGLSATSGMSTFSTKGGLYEKAQSRFGVSNGKQLFTYSFYEKHKADAQAFFADIYVEAKRAKPGAGHQAIAALAAAGKLQRHYTLNIDGLATAAGMSVWHHQVSPEGCTVEMHGSIRQLLCPVCGLVIPMNDFLSQQLRRRTKIPCTACSCPALRSRIMMYGDAEGEKITPDDVWERMEDDVQAADLILWVGISFEQSASTMYFRRVRQFLAQADRLASTQQAIINLSDESLWNLLSACSNTRSLEVLEVLGTCDEVLKLVAAAVCKPAGATPDLLEPPSKPLEPPDQPLAAKKPGQEEASGVLPGANVLTIATTD